MSFPVIFDEFANRETLHTAPDNDGVVWLLKFDNGVWRVWLKQTGAGIGEVGGPEATVLVNYREGDDWLLTCGAS